MGQWAKSDYIGWYLANRVVPHINLSKRYNLTEGIDFGYSIMGEIDYLQIYSSGDVRWDGPDLIIAVIHFAKSFRWQ